MRRNHLLAQIIRILPVLMLSVGLSQPVFAGVSPGFYSGTVAVTDRSPAAFNNGMVQALQQVLIRASAEPQETVAQNAYLMSEWANAEKYASQYQYMNKAVMMSNGATQNQIFLKVNFSPSIIAPLLSKAGLRNWSPNRPDLLIIPLIKKAGVEGAGDNAMQFAPEVVYFINDSAQRYGLPFLKGETSTDQLEKLWQVDKPTIRNTARLYNKKTVVLAQMSIGIDGRVSGKWLVIDDKQIRQAEIVQNNLAMFVDAGLFWVANAMAGQFAMAFSGQLTSVNLAVNGIDDFTSYQKVTDYLKAMAIVSSVNVVVANGSSVNLSVQLKGGVDQFQSMLLNDKKLLVSDEISTDINQLSYYWNN